MISDVHGRGDTVSAPPSLQARWSQHWNPVAQTVYAGLHLVHSGFHHVACAIRCCRDGAFHLLHRAAAALRALAPRIDLRVVRFADFFAGARFAVDFRTPDFFVAGFREADFFATGLFAADFFATGRFAPDLFAPGFLTADFLAAAFFAVPARFFATLLRFAMPNSPDSCPGISHAARRPRAARERCIATSGAAPITRISAPCNPPTCQRIPRPVPMRHGIIPRTPSPAREIATY